MDQLEELIEEWESLKDGEKDTALEITRATLTAWRAGEASGCQHKGDCYSFYPF